MIEKLKQKAEIFIESLPYIKTFSSKTFVIKYGGSAMKDEELKKDIIHNIILLKYIGINPVIVHGGGPILTDFLEKFGKKTEFINGLRITDKDTMEIVQMVLAGKINPDIVSLINLYGGKGIGLTGKDANTIIARKHHPEIKYDSEGKNEKTVDLGFVGEVEKIDPTTIKNLSETGYIPVIAPIGAGINGESYNINADAVAGEVAQALKAEKLIMLTDVDGIYEAPENKATKITSLTINKAMQMISNNRISGGMIPKVKACINAVSNGVKRTHIIDGKEKNAILLEIFTDKGIGTMVTNN